MGDLSTHFSTSEFACQDGCGFSTVDTRLIDALEELRRAVGQPMKINSGCRCPKHNAAVGGTPGSLHLRGSAADIAVAGMTAGALYVQAAKVAALKGIGVCAAGGWIHVDVRTVKTRWKYVGKQRFWWDGGGL